MPKWDAVFFDLDNTLYSHEYAFEKAIQDCYQELLEEWELTGRHIPHVDMDDWFEVFKHFSDKWWPEYENKEISQRAYRRKRYMSTMRHFKLPHDEDEADQFHDKYYAKAHIYVQPYPFLYPVLQQLQDAGTNTGVITNGKSEVQWLKYKKLKLYRYIPRERFIVSEEVNAEKPSKHIFQKAVKELHPRRPVFIGDAWELDIVGAIDAGWEAIYLNTQQRPRTTSHQPLYECRTLEEIHQFFLQQ
ncbi:HAD family hydrolase [Caldalkalibacillus salinus]|uniref:HAD family hydrolase n=1 Tax=Caldalkalibacillus salinus TaxID=2803787 RepID=UPI0019247706|nr:HAD-IA family hydrolase [Caldalkalibacillus salinus]